ncbi:MAG: hypothetical protein ACI4D3_16365 [Lachnospiraceae bacterium]
MMMQQTNYAGQAAYTGRMNYATAGIFGAYVSGMRTVPGRERTEEQRRRDAEKRAAVFEMIEDYIEQA